MEPGWREREAIETWHRDWKPVWLRWRAYLVEHPGWQPPSEIAVRRQVTELVATWNACTGQHRAPDEVLRHLAPEDYRDRELMQPGALGLYVWTCLGEPLP